MIENFHNKKVKKQLWPSDQLQNQQTHIHLANLFPDLLLYQDVCDMEGKLRQFPFSGRKQ